MPIKSTKAKPQFILKTEVVDDAGASHPQEPIIEKAKSESPSAKPFPWEPSNLPIQDEKNTPIVTPPPVASQSSPSQEPDVPATSPRNQKTSAVQTIRPQPSSANIDSIPLDIEEVPIERSNRRLYILGILVFLGIAIIVGSFFLFWTKQKTASLQIAPLVPTIVDTTIGPSPTSAFNRSNFSLEVQNGSGISGAAAKTADRLKSLGYTILKTGNADKSTYKESQVYVAKDLTDLSPNLIADIKDILPNATYSGVLKSSTASARIIIGLK